MKFTDLVGKTISSAQLMKKEDYDDRAWARLDFTDGTHCFVVASYGDYSGKSKDEYPAYVVLCEEVEGLAPIEKT